MNKIPVWRGNDIGHGKKGGVLSVGSHEIKIGKEVPINLLSDSAIKTLKAKGAIVMEAPEVESDDELLTAKELVKSTGSALTAAKKALTESNKYLKQAKTNVTDQQKVIDNLPESEEEAHIQAEESLIELNGILTESSGKNEGFKLAKENAEQASKEAKEALLTAES
jgi:hypothetical protein